MGITTYDSNIKKNSELGSPLAKSLIWDELGGGLVWDKSLQKNTQKNMPSRISLKIVESLIWDEVVKSGGLVWDEREAPKMYSPKKYPPKYALPN